MKQYKDLVQKILDEGIGKSDRTGTGTKSIFGHQMRFDMSEGFPLVTLKKTHYKSIIHELLWFLRGDTNIKYLVDNDCHIWVGDAYKKYKEEWSKSVPGDGKFNESEYNTPTPHEAVSYTKEEFIDKIKTDDEFAKKWGDLGPIYGKQWRSWTNVGIDVQNTSEDGKSWSGECWDEEGIDQIQNSINLLKTDPDSRRNIISAWNVGELEQMTLPPCHYGFQVYTRELSEGERGLLLQPYGLDPLTKEGRDRVWKENNLPTRAISLSWNQRSVDTFLGLPFNIASYGILLHMFSQCTNMVPGDLIGNLGDTHLYLNHLDQCEEMLKREPKELCKLELNKDITNIFDFKYDDINIVDYDRHPAIKAPISV